MKLTKKEQDIYNEVCDKYKHHWLNTTITNTMAIEIADRIANQRVIEELERIKIEFAPFGKAHIEERIQELKQEPTDKLTKNDEISER